MDFKKVKNFQIFSVIFTFILGTLLHFTYKWSGGNNIVAIFSSINESVWEHLKLLYFPMLITIIIGAIYFKNEVSNFVCAKTIGIISSILFTVIFFFTYTGVLGKNIAAIDVLSFFIATILGEYVAYRLIQSRFKCKNRFDLIILIVLGISFILFTYFTPEIGIFKDPATGNYGLIKTNI